MGVDVYKGNLDFGILFPKSKHVHNKFLGYFDANWCIDNLDGRSTTSYVFMFMGSPISW